MGKFVFIYQKHHGNIFTSPSIYGRLVLISSGSHGKIRIHLPKTPREHFYESFHLWKTRSYQLWKPWENSYSFTKNTAENLGIENSGANTGKHFGGMYGGTPSET
jgi:hypothetical protein